MKPHETKSFHCANVQCKVHTFDLTITGLPGTRRKGEKFPKPIACPFCGSTNYTLEAA
jgi:hypothetical protein